MKKINHPTPPPQPITPICLMLQHDKRFIWNKYDLPLLVYLLTSRWCPLWPQDRPAPSPGNAAQRAPTASCIVHTHTVCILYNVELHCRGLHRVGLSKRKRQMPSALLGSFHCVYGTGKDWVSHYIPGVKEYSQTKLNQWTGKCQTAQTTFDFSS